MDDYDCAACGGDGDRPAGLDWVTCIYCRGSGLSSAGHRALEEKMKNRHDPYCKASCDPYTDDMNNAANIARQNDALRTGDLRIVNTRPGKYVVVNYRTNTCTVEFNLAAARRVLKAAQR